MEDDGASVVAAIRAKQLQIVQKFSDLLLLPRVTALVVRDSENPIIKKFLKRFRVVHKVPIPSVVGRLSDG